MGVEIYQCNWNFPAKYYKYLIQKENNKQNKLTEQNSVKV